LAQRRRQVGAARQQRGRQHVHGQRCGSGQGLAAQLRQQRGSNSIYHNNSIQTWQVKPDGSVFNVQLA